MVVSDPRDEELLTIDHGCVEEGRASSFIQSSIATGREREDNFSGDPTT